MKYFGVFDAQGFPAAFYPETEGLPVAPEEAVQVTEEQYLELLTYQGLRRFVNGQVVEYTPPPAAAPIPNEISRRQFFQQLANIEIITRDDALAALTSGAIPSPLQAIINGLSTDDDKFNAQMLVIGAQTFNRTHPLAEIVRQAMQWTVEQKDNFWQDAAKL